MVHIATIVHIDAVGFGEVIVHTMVTISVEKHATPYFNPSFSMTALRHS